MGNHRAERRGPRRRRSDLPTPVVETAVAPVSLAEAAVVETTALPVSTRTQPVAGKRRAEKPRRVVKAPKAARAARTATPAPTVEPVVRSHAADQPAAAPKTRTTPARRAARRAAPRGPLFKALPSPPLVLGVAALAISAGGAITAANGGLTDQPTRFSQASALSGASDISRVNVTSKRTVSRDSRRDALEDTTEGELEEVVEAQAEEHFEALAKLANKADQVSARLALNAWVVPLEGYRLTARYGEYGLWSSYHTGLDFAADTGTPIVSMSNGVVTEAGSDGAYGNKTVVTLDDGTEIWYCHQNTIEVSVGDTVHSGERIGTVGSTGHVTGPHLHLEVRPGAGDPVDPYAALIAHGVTP